MMVEYKELTGKGRDYINKFFMDEFNVRKGTSFKCGDDYYNVIHLENGDYLISELELDLYGYVVDATSLLRFRTLNCVCKCVFDIANL